jgi:uncharacterized protein YkwD
VEITASDSSGEAVLANFPIWCGQKPPAELTIRTDFGEPVFSNSEQAEAFLADLIKRDRAAAGLPALTVDARLSRVARLHSQEMQRTGAVAHISARTGSAADRVRRASIAATLVLENVARAYGVGEAEEGLMNSPGHRANILSDQVGVVGLGVVLGEEVSGRRELFVTQLFLRAPEKIDVKTALRRVHEIIERHRALASDPDLDEVAGRFAARLAAGMPNDQASEESAAELRGKRTPFVRVTSLVTAVAEVDTFDPSETLRAKSITHYGVGLARGHHPEIGDGAIFIVLLLGQE